RGAIPLKVAKMKSLLTFLLPYVGKHWLRIGILGIFFILINQKQIDLSIQLGKPSVVPPRTAPVQPAKQAAPETEQQVYTELTPKQQSGWVERLNVFGNGTDTKVLQRHLSATDPTIIQAFIRRFSQVAKTEQQKYGIPASIILANALLHAQSGEAPLAKQGNNFFALDCSEDWLGERTSYQGGCYRKYQNAWTSFRDHSLYVTSGKYSTLPQLGSSHYQAWAQALEELDYANTEELAEQLLQVIDEWQLFQYD
ncbi:MAG: glucosaminidase domain-containing protein, partial [Bacteroidota bacterium]